MSDIFFERLLLTGILDIFSQAVIMPRLLQVLTDKKIAMLGMMSEIVGYSLLVISAMVHVSLFLIIGMILFGIGDAIFGPAFNGLLSKSVTDSEQGRIQGGAQSIQAFARVLGPVLGGQLYAVIDHSMPALMGVLFISVAVLILNKQ